MISDSPSTVNPFSAQLLGELEQAVNTLKAQCEPPWIAAFDADGTLWSTDVGELLFQHQLKHDLLAQKSEEIEKKYQELCEKDNHDELYLWQAELNGNFAVDQVKEWIIQSQENQLASTIFPDQRQLIQWLKNQDVDVFIVSASFAPTVAWAAQSYFQVQEENVIAVTLPIENKKYLARSQQAVTSGPGKVQRLLEATGGIAPVISVGNTLSDLALLESSRHFRLAVRSVESSHRNFNSENGLHQRAIEASWSTHRF